MTIEDSEIGLPNVNIQFKHPGGKGKHCHTTTNRDGKFNGILYSPQVQLKHITKLGETNLDAYTYEEWMQGVDTRDILAIIHHILGSKRLNGYRQLAADVNRDGKVTVRDAILLKDLLLGKIEAFDYYSGPWQFVPEAVSEKYQRQFNQDPFNMIIDGDQYESEAPYLDLSWTYRIENGQNGKAGFGAFKLGDVDGSNLEIEHQPGLAASQDYNESQILRNNLNGQDLKNIDIEALYNSLKGDADPLELLDQMSVFPNPTPGEFQIRFQAEQHGIGEVLVMDSFGKTVYTTHQNFVVGQNKVEIDTPNLPSGVLKISIVTEEGVFTKNIVKTIL